MHPSHGEIGAAVLMYQLPLAESLQQIFSQIPAEPLEYCRRKPVMFVCSFFKVLLEMMCFRRSNLGFCKTQDSGSLKPFNAFRWKWARVVCSNDCHKCCQYQSSLELHKVSPNLFCRAWEVKVGPQIPFHQTDIDLREFSAAFLAAFYQKGLYQALICSNGIMQYRSTSSFFLHRHALALTSILPSFAPQTKIKMKCQDILWYVFCVTFLHPLTHSDGLLALPCSHLTLSQGCLCCTASIDNARRGCRGEVR